MRKIPVSCRAGGFSLCRVAEKKEGLEYTKGKNPSQMLGNLDTGGRRILVFKGKVRQHQILKTFIMVSSGRSCHQVFLDALPTWQAPGVLSAHLLTPCAGSSLA